MLSHEPVSYTHLDVYKRQLRERGEELFESYVKRLKEFRERTQALHRIRVADIERRANIYDVDMSKIIISDIKGKIPGNELYERLRCEYGLSLIHIYALGWMCDHEVSVSIPSKSTQIEYLTLTAASARTWSIVTMILLPVLALARCV